MVICISNSPKTTVLKFKCTLGNGIHSLLDLAKQVEKIE